MHMLQKETTTIQLSIPFYSISRSSRPASPDTNSILLNKVLFHLSLGVGKTKKLETSSCSLHVCRIQYAACYVRHAICPLMNFLADPFKCLIEFKIRFDGQKWCHFLPLGLYSC